MLGIRLGVTFSAVITRLGEIPVPKGLKVSGSVVNKSSRDSDNNIIVYWVHPDDTAAPKTGLPSDGSVCWLHVAAFGAWTENYCEGNRCPSSN